MMHLHREVDLGIAGTGGIGSSRGGGPSSFGGAYSNTALTRMRIQD